MAIVEFANVVIEALSTDVWPEKEDGWFLKALDTGESYIRRNGEWEYINLGLAFIKATKSGTVTTDGTGQATVSLVSSFIDSDYTVALTCTDQGGTPIALVSNKTINGFNVKTRNAQNGNDLGNVVVSWLATRDYDP